MTVKEVHLAGVPKQQEDGSVVQLCVRCGKTISSMVSRNVAHIREKNPDAKCGFPVAGMVISFTEPCGVGTYLIEFCKITKT